METIIAIIMYILLLFVFLFAWKMGFPFKWILGIVIVVGALMLEYPWIGVLLAAIIALKYLSPKSRPIIIISAVVIIFGMIQYEKFEERREAKKAAVMDSVKKNASKAIEKTINAVDEDNNEAFEEQVTEDSAQIPSEELDIQDEVDEPYDEYPMQNQELRDAVVDYGYALVDAINYGDFTIVEPYLLPESNLYNAQVKLVDNLFGKNITESLYEIDVTSVTKISENTYEVETFEDIGIVTNGLEENKQFSWVYTVEYVNDQYLLSEIKAPV